MVVRAWNMLGGLDWNGLPVVAEVLGIDDVEWLVYQLITLRDFYRERSSAR